MIIVPAYGVRETKKSFYLSLKGTGIFNKGKNGLVIKQSNRLT